MSYEVDLLKIGDDELFEETARRLKDFVESQVVGNFTYGEVLFVFHAGHLAHIECKPSLRPYVRHMKPEMSKNGRK